MASWHQQQNPAGLLALWTPHPTKWKCIRDTYGHFASCMTFDNAVHAREYAAKTGDMLLAPANNKESNRG